MNGEENFQIREIRQEPSPIQPMPPKKKGGGLISLFSKKNLPKTLLVIVIISILIAAAAIIWGRHSFSKAKVEIDIEAPGSIASGEEVVLTINYKNSNRVNLNDAYLVIDYPQGTFSSEGKEIYQEQKKLGRILRKSQGKEEFKVRFVGEKGVIKNLSARLNYQPQNINSRFENFSSLRIEINSVLIGIKIEGPEKVVSGQGIGYLIEYENKTNEDIFNLRIELTFSDDFKPENFKPEPVEGTNNIWQVDVLKPGEKRTIELGGILDGGEGENKILKTTIGKMENNVFLQYSQSDFITQIAPSPLLLLLRIEGAEEVCKVNPDQELIYKIEFKNNTDVAFEALLLRAYLGDEVFDFKTIGLGGRGFFDSRKGIVTWSGAEVRGLALLEPGQSGEVSFSIKIKDSLPIFSYNDKNFEAKVSAEIEVLTAPMRFSVSELKFEKELVCKINSELDLKTKVYYYEPSPGIINTGPLPPEVDQLTTYTVHWQITNTSNDLENVEVKAFLPQGISWSNYYINNVQNSEVYYNERTKELIWEINRVPAATGVILPVYELVFQIGLRPSIHQVGQMPTLINESSIEGKDSFTEVILKDFTPEVNTSLPDDPRVGSRQGRVVE